jgi:hypothetical protein
MKPAQHRQASRREPQRPQPPPPTTIRADESELGLPFANCFQFRPDQRLKQTIMPQRYTEPTEIEGNPVDIGRHRAKLPVKLKPRVDALHPVRAYQGP